MQEFYFPPFCTSVPLYWCGNKFEALAHHQCANVQYIVIFLKKHLLRLPKELCSIGALILDQCCWLPCLGWLVIGAINSVPDCRA